MSRFNQLVKLKPGNRYTIVGLGEFGFPYSRKITLDSVHFGKYAQYDDDDSRDPLTIRLDNGRWVSFGYVIAKKPGN